MLGTAAAGLVPSALRAQTPTQRSLGGGVSAYGERSPFETKARQVGAPRYPQAASSRTPLQDLRGIITPSALHFERHHAGVPDIDPSAHRLLIHGLVDSPLVLCHGFTFSSARVTAGRYGPTRTARHPRARTG